jgi:hypothetical protein
MQDPTPGPKQGSPQWKKPLEEVNCTLAAQMAAWMRKRGKVRPPCQQLLTRSAGRLPAPSCVDRRCGFQQHHASSIHGRGNPTSDHACTCSTAAVSSPLSTHPFGGLLAVLRPAANCYMLCA